MLVALSACGGASSYELKGRTTAPGTDGQVVVERIEGGNKLVSLSLDHLVPPSRLGPGLQIFAVWFVGPTGAQLAGQLLYDEDTRRGHLSATTPMGKFKLMVTAEKGPGATKPGDVVVTTRRVRAP